MIQDASLMVPDTPCIDPGSILDRSWIDPGARILECFLGARIWDLFLKHTIFAKNHIFAKKNTFFIKK